MRWGMLAIFLLGGCSSGPHVLVLGVIGPQRTEIPHSAGQSPGQCNTTADCPSGLICGYNRLCYGGVLFVPERDPSNSEE